MHDVSPWRGATEKQAAFLTAMVLYLGNRKKATRAVPVARSLVYRWLASDATFRGLYDDARRRAAERAVAETEARMHAESTERFDPGVFPGEGWDEDRIARSAAVKEAIEAVVKVIQAKVPPSLDRDLALRKMQEVRIGCNWAINHPNRRLR